MSAVPSKCSGIASASRRAWRGLWRVWSNRLDDGVWDRGTALRAAAERLKQIGSGVIAVMAKDRLELVVRKKGVELWGGNNTYKWRKTSQAATCIESVWGCRERGVRDIVCRDVRASDVERRGLHQNGANPSEAARRIKESWAGRISGNGVSGRTIPSWTMAASAMGVDEFAGKLWHRRERGLGCVDDQETRDREQCVPGGRSRIGGCLVVVPPRHCVLLASAFHRSTRAGLRGLDVMPSSQTLRKSRLALDCRIGRERCHAREPTR